MTGKFPEKQTKSIDKFNYCYFDVGTGNNVIIFLHGMAAGKEATWNMFSTLSSEFRCIFLDLPGHNGVSLDGIDSVDDLASYVEIFVDRLGISTFNLVGFSMGGIVALTIEGRNKTTATLNKSVIWASPILGYDQGTNTRAKLVYELIKRSPDQMWQKVFRNKQFEQIKNLLGVKLNSIEAELAANFRKDTRVKLIEIIKDWKSPEIDRLPKLFIFGTDDPIINNSNVKYVVSCDKNNCKLINKPKAGHYGKREAWNDAIKEVRNFLSE